MTSCFSGQMLSGDELREALISAAKPIEQTEVVTLSEALGHNLCTSKGAVFQLKIITLVAVDLL